jgi:hypothetical protein
VDDVARLDALAKRANSLREDTPFDIHRDEVVVIEISVHGFHGHVESRITGRRIFYGNADLQLPWHV